VFEFLTYGSSIPVALSNNRLSVNIKLDTPYNRTIMVTEIVLEQVLELVIVN